MFPSPNITRVYLLFHICLMGEVDFNAGSLSWIAMVIRK